MRPIQSRSASLGKIVQPPQAVQAAPEVVPPATPRLSDALCPDLLDRIERTERRAEQEFNTGEATDDV